MTRTRKPRKSYQKAFKLEALRLMAESDRPSAEIAAELGLSPVNYLFYLGGGFGGSHPFRPGESVFGVGFRGGGGVGRDGFGG